MALRILWGPLMFAKVFTQILDSSLAIDYQVRHVFEDLLKLADINGVVDSTIDSISRRTNVPFEIVKRGIEALEKPDASSRTPDHEGRRIIRIDEHRDWGWMIVNYEYYRNLASESQRREKTRQRVQNHRHKQSCNADVTQCNAHTEKCNDSPSTSSSPSPSAYTGEPKRAAFKKPETPELELHATKIGLPLTEVAKFQDYYESNGWRVGKNPMKSWQSSMNNWKRNVDQRKFEPSVATNGKRALTPLDIRTIIQAKREQAATLKNRHCSETAMDSVWNCDDSRGQYFQLMREVKELNQKLGAYQ
jgi:hypothetical protein